MRGAQVPTRVHSVLIGFGLVAVTIGGCTVNGPDPAPTTSAPKPETKTSRPKDLSLAGKQDADLCKLLTEEQQSQLRVARPRPVAKDGTNDFPGCIWSGETGQTGYSVAVRAVPMSMADFRAKRGDESPDTAATYAVGAGFPAAQGQRGGGFEQLGCNVDVDVADGQTLDTFVSPNVNGTMSNQDMCTKAKQAAEAAVTTLQGQG